MLSEDSLQIDGNLVLALLLQQHPDLAGLPLRRVARGWDNEIFRLGEELCVRLPRRTAAASLVLNEQGWLPHLASKLPVPTKRPAIPCADVRCRTAPPPSRAAC